MAQTSAKYVHFLKTLVLILVINGSANADRRGYVWTYEYMTMPRGESELEYYLTTKVHDLHDYEDKNTWEHQIEYEYGLTDHWDAAVYQRWQHTNTSTKDRFEYTGTKLRTRYRIGEKGMYPVDTLLYLEYKRPDGSDEPDVLEGKLILAKDINRFNVAYNQIMECGINNEGTTEHGYGFGLNCEFGPRWKVGFESTGNYTDDKYHLGPTVSRASERIWITAGLLRGLNDRSDDLQFRIILGYPF